MCLFKGIEVCLGSASAIGGGINSISQRHADNAGEIAHQFRLLINIAT